MAKTLAYDLNGDLTTDATATSTNTYEWDAADRFTAINVVTASGTNRSEFAYDGLGRRVQIAEKTNGVVTSTKKFLWCGAELCEERDSTGATVTKRFFGQGEQISGTNYFFTPDHLGSVREMLDGTGTIRARYDYDPYGRRTKVQGDLDPDFAFTGHYYHQNSGLSLTLYRGYDPETRRWISRDPIGEYGGINLYRFVGNNPINFIDTFGLNQEDVQRILMKYEFANRFMEQEGHRVPYIPQLSSLVSDLYINNGQGWECVRQAQFVSDFLNADAKDEPYYDQWTISTVASPHLWHTWVRAVSSNPFDPVITLDPWKGRTIVSPSTSPISNINFNSVPKITIK